MAGNEQIPVVTIPDELSTEEKVREFIQKELGRRGFLKGVGVAGLGAVAFQFGCASSASEEKRRQVYVANAQGMVVSDNSRCVGCRRCEVACTGYNLGVARPALANVKVGRNLDWGPVYQGTPDSSGQGLFGNFRIVQDTCRQCAHPVPCLNACPNAAIEVVPPVNARVVNEEKCTGCGVCLRSCPWEMASLTGPLNGEKTKSRKCNLCNGAPECVEACPAGALQYVPWSDRTKEVPPRQVVPASVELPQDVKDSCRLCH